MQFVAMLTMLIDHAGYMFDPQQPFWRIIGRLAFPIYCYCIVLGAGRTRSPRNYMIRLLIIGIISQPFYMLALDITGVNVIGTLSVSLLVLLLLKRVKTVAAQFLIIVPAGLFLELIPFDYGAYGLLLVLIYHYTAGDRMVVFHAILNVAYFFYAGVGSGIIQMFSLLATVGIVYAPEIVQWFEQIRVPRWLWRSFYPAHLLALFLIAVVTRGS